ncbi:GntR family transcriptional regulator [Mangrovibacillus cuniculi]|uniref:GntR family transcriptional regulator n=1 Tax=Mangrovibacillus cuniculi TaxID=2593652 RepID=A0A7S8HFH8_9BACI|nr:GntR family transcriptional regulator [Mangrovibacillus cuniculi]QPC46536.1 GntR family transcriptional regulator [Mangrovibacillus cuniculi]
MIQLDIRSRQPIYEQLIEGLKNRIIHEELQADEQLPSVRSLAKDLTINPNTIQKAYRELENQGYIYSVPGKGSFIAPQAKQKKEEKVEEMKEQLKQLFSEALFLGVKKEDIMQLLLEVETDSKGGQVNDQGDKRF